MVAGYLPGCVCIGAGYLFYQPVISQKEDHSRHRIMDLSYILNELGEEREDYFNAVSPPIAQTSNFSFKTVADFRQALSGEFDANLYSRGNNPTINILRKKLAALDGADDALVFGSGVAAIA